MVGETVQAKPVATESLAPAISQDTPAVDLAVVPPSAAEPEPTSAAAPVAAEEAPVVEGAITGLVPPAMIAAVDAENAPKAEIPAVLMPEPVDLDATLAESGLVMVQTTATTTFEASAEPPVKLGRPRKPKPVVEQTEEEPLVMVETGK